MNHTHDDARLTFGCPACAAAVIDDQAAAELAAAPTRRCTWHCRYLATTTGDDNAIATLTFTLDVKVPPGRTGSQVDDQYCGLAGERFMLTLPDTLTDEAVHAAIETMEVVRVSIGATLPDTIDGPVEPASVPLFDLDGAA
jgi:hypothetical protein